MNEKNYQDITETVLPKIGFPNGLLDERILTLMKSNTQTFVVQATDSMGADQMQYDVRFAKSDKNPADTNYYLNAVTATMTKPDGEVRKHEFKYFFTDGFTIGQINNIMDGRSVYSQFPKKDDPTEVHKMWTAVNFNEKDENGLHKRSLSFEEKTNFNLVIEAGKIIIPNQSVEEKNKMLRDLKNGDKYLANIKMPDGTIQKANLVALPHAGQIAAYDMDGKRLQYTKSTMQALPMTTKTDKTVDKTTASILGKDESKDLGKGAGKSKTA